MGSQKDSPIKIKTIHNKNVENNDIIEIGIISGITKMLLMPEDVEFFTTVGLNETLIILIGITQPI